MARLDLLDPFTHIQPGPLISQYENWILFTLLLFFFWAVVGISLRRRFKESRSLRVLVTSTSLLLTVATYYSVYRGWLHLSLQGLGMFGAILVLIVVFFILFGMMRGYGMQLHTVLPIGYALFYISLWAVSPNILHTIGDIFPPLNLILLFLFVISVWKSVVSFFHHSRSPLDAAKRLNKMEISTPTNIEIDREIKQDKKERTLIKTQSLRLTKTGINSVEDIQNLLKRMVHLVRNQGNSVDEQEIARLTKALREIFQKENLLKKGIDLMRRHVNAYNSIHKKDIGELEKRLGETEDSRKRRTIEEEIHYQKKMLQVLKFMEKYEAKVVEFTQSFNKLLYAAMDRLKSRYPNDAFAYLEHAQRNLSEMKGIYEEQRYLENYLLKLNKKTISDLKKEKGRA